MTQLAELETRVGDTVIIAPCVEVVLYLGRTNDAALLDFYHRSRALLGSRLTHYWAQSMKGPRELNERGEAMVPTWFTNPRKGKEDYHMFMTQDDPNERTSASRLYMSVFRKPEEDLEKDRKEWASIFQKYQRPLIYVCSILRLTLPLDHPMADPGKLIAWILDLKIVQESQSFTGHSSYAVNHFNQPVFPDLHNPMKQSLASILLRYPGLGWDVGGLEISRYLPESNEYLLLMKRASWFNLACDATLAHIGGREAVQKQLENEPGMKIHQLAHGLAIQVGETPQIGDLGHREFLPEYRPLAKVIRPIRLEKLGSTSVRLDQANEWLNFFDKEYE